MDDPRVNELLRRRVAEKRCRKLHRYAKRVARVIDLYMLGGLEAEIIECDRLERRRVKVVQRF